jgi:enamine deaminase RidA (YjgF/YER057c/UK114 family)
MTAEPARTNFHHAILPLFCPTKQTIVSLFPNSEKTNDFRFMSTVHGVVFAFFVLSGSRLPLRSGVSDRFRGVPMPIQHFAPPPHVKAPPLSFATRVGDLLFISGIPGFDANGALPDGFEAQFANVVVNIKRVLGEAGAGIGDLVKVNVLLPRAADVAAMNALYAGAFGPPPYPARTTCVVQALPDPKMLIEIEAVASLSR